MSNTITVLLAAALIGYFVYSNYGMRQQVGALEVQITDLQGDLSDKDQQVRQVTAEKDREIERLKAETRRKESQGISEEAMKEKEAEIAALEEKLQKAKEYMKQQNDQLSWHKAQLRQSQEMLSRGR